MNGSDQALRLARQLLDTETVCYPFDDQIRSDELLVELALARQRLNYSVELAIGDRSEVDAVEIEGMMMDIEEMFEQRLAEVAPELLD